MMKSVTQKTKATKKMMIAEKEVTQSIYIDMIMPKTVEETKYQK